MPFPVLKCLVVCSLLVACSGKPHRHHDAPLPDPKGFNAHFGDMDSGKDGRVGWEEFKAFFPHAEPAVFAAVDLNGDRTLDHQEWHAFKSAHGLKHHD
jgi:hypothetical protein